MAARKNRPSCPRELSWLARRVKLKQFKFARRTLPLSPHASAKTRIQRCLYREVDEIWQYCAGGDLTIFNKDHNTVEEGQSQTEAFTTIAMYS